MNDYSIFLLLFTPIYFLFILIELLIINHNKDKFHSSAQYYWKDAAANTTLALLYQLSEKVFAFMVIGVYGYFFQYRLFNIDFNWKNLLLLLLLQDFCYYWFHRASHRCRWLWAAHVVHHSSTHLNFLTAFRQSLMYPIAGMWLFWLPLVILGFPAEMVLLSVGINLLYQFFIHTQIVNRIGFLEKILNTPEHHRVHHGCNPCYLDKNYGGILIIWDKMFGTFKEYSPKQPIQYGITEPINSYNPLTITFHEWIAMINTFKNTKGFYKKILILMSPPQNKPQLYDAKRVNTKV